MFSRKPFSKYWRLSLAIAVAYFATGYVGLQMPAVSTNITLIWLPTGIAVASLYRFGNQYWPAISLASVIVNLTVGIAWPTCVGIALGNTLGPLLTTFLLRKLQFTPHFARQRDIALLAIAAHLGMLVSASNGIAVLVLSGSLTNDIFKAWLCWWAGDSMGVIAAAPLVLVASYREFAAIRTRFVEFTCWLILTMLVTGGVFVLNDNISDPAWALAFVPLPLMAWATLRFGATGTSLAVILISMGAAYGTSIQSGPFYRSDATQQVFLLWIYMVTTATLGWLIAALHFTQVQALNIQRVLENGLRDASLGVLLTDTDRLITYVNEGFTRLTGYDATELLGRNCDVLQGDDSDPKTVLQIRASLDGGGHFDGEILNYRKDGTTFWNGLLISPIRNDRGDRVGFFGIQRDITSEVEIKFALQRSEARLRTILDLEPECVKIVSADGRLLEMNPAGLAMIEADSMEQVRGAMLETLIEENHRTAFRKLHAEVLAGGSGSCEFSIVGLKGARRWLESHTVPYRDTNGKIIGQLSVTRDITSRKRAEEQIQVSQQRFQAIVERSHDLILIFDCDGFISFVNPASREVLGYAPDEMIGQHNSTFLPPEDRQSKARELDAIVQNSRVEFRSELRVQHKDGSWIVLEAVGINLLDVPALAGLVVNCRDVTERKEREVRTLNERAFFEMLTTGASLFEILNQIASSSELQSPGMQCSILLLDETGERLQQAAAPTLPQAYCQAIDGTQIGPKVGSCGTAAFTRQRVITPCIESDPLWKDYCELALRYGLRACWSVPMISSRGRVLGTLAMYYSEPRFPSVTELATIERAAYCAVVAIERHEMLTSLREYQIRMDTLVGNLPGMAYRRQIDTHWTMTYVSSGCEAVTGYLRDELEQNRSVTCVDLVHPDDRDWVRRECQSSLEAHVPWSNTYRLIDKAGQMRWVMERASGVYSEDGTLRFVDGFIQDITEARRIEEQVRTSLCEKEAMLKEIHHRVKNNLQIVTSLLNLQVGTVQDAAVLSALSESRDRIRSMALVHETLYLSGNLGQIDLSQYLDSLCRHLFRSYGVDASQIRLRLNVAKTSLDLERAIPFGLIVNELVSNSLKYAFPSGRTGHVVVDFQSAPAGYYTFRVSDDGIGLPETLDLKELKSLGLQLVLDLIQQLSGTLNITYGQGTDFCITFPLRYPHQEYKP